MPGHARHRAMAFACLVAFSLAPTQNGFACGNGYFLDFPEDTRPVKLDGTRTYDRRNLVPLSYIDPSSDYHRYIRKRWKTNQARLKEKFEKSGDFRHESDYALALLHNGSVAEALRIFQRLTRQHPDEYVLAANLGTAYELNGNNREALRWIKKAVQLHPGSHEGTEWLHENILEAKIAAQAGAKATPFTSIVGVDFGSAPKPEWPARLEDSPAARERIVKALRYQLRERVQFVPPHDPVVAQLLFDLSTLVALEVTVDDAQQILEIALKYAEGRQKKILERRHRFYRAHLNRSIYGGIHRHPWIFAGLVILLIGLIRILVIRRREETAIAEAKAEALASAGINPDEPTHPEVIKSPPLPPEPPPPGAKPTA